MFIQILRKKEQESVGEQLDSTKYYECSTLHCCLPSIKLIVLLPSGWEGLLFLPSVHVLQVRMEQIDMTCDVRML